MNFYITVWLRLALAVSKVLFYFSVIVKLADLGALSKICITSGGGTVSLRFTVSIQAPSILMVAAIISPFVISCSMLHRE